MVNRLDASVTSTAQQVLNFLSIIKHPVEGIAYLIYISIFVRWRWPRAWNQLLERCKASEKTNQTTPPKLKKQ